MSRTKPPYHNDFTGIPVSVDRLVEQVRHLSAIDGMIRVRTDNSVRTVISFTANWAHQTSQPNRRRVFLETKVKDGIHRLVFSSNVLVEDPPTNEYDDTSLEHLPTDLMRYLRSGVITSRQLKEIAA